MSASQLKPGDRVFVVTDSLCQYQGFFRTLNESNGTFLLTKVRPLGSKDGSIKASNKIHDCVEFVAANVKDFLLLEDEDGLRSDPAIVSVTNGYTPNQRRRSSFAQVRRNNMGYNVPQYDDARPRYQQREYRQDYWQPSERSYGRRERVEPQYHRYQYKPRPPPRSYWAQNQRFQPRDSIQREGSFPQKNPGQKKNIGEFDIDKALEEFSRLKVDGDEAEIKADKGYNKNESFFDSLTVDASDDEKEIEMERASPRKSQQRVDQNVLTFGEDTVRSLNLYRKPYFGNARPPTSYRYSSGFRGGRYENGYAGGYGAPPQYGRSRGYMHQRFY